MVDNYDFYIVGIPIGNYEDITLRAIRTLKSVDFVVCEKSKEYKKLCGIVGIEIKEHISCTRKNEREVIGDVLKLLKEGKRGALVSDCGTPLFEDPGSFVLDSIRKKEYSITSLPGASSLMVALSLSPVKISDFYFKGFLHRNTTKREDELRKILKRKETIILLETPYRLTNIIEFLVKIANKRRIFIPFNLTMESEKKFFGYPADIKNELKMANIKKGEFLIFIYPPSNSSS